MKDMTLKELNDYAGLLCSLQLEYESKLGKNCESNEKNRLTTILNLIIEEKSRVNRQKYKPV